MQWVLVSAAESCSAIDMVQWGLYCPGDAAIAPPSGKEVNPASSSNKSNVRPTRLIASKIDRYINNGKKLFILTTQW
jgi:hypothetical protein